MSAPSRPIPSLRIALLPASAIAPCLRIREEVFIRGQGVQPHEEVDGRDPDCLHLLARIDREPAGCARLRITGSGRARAERVAVLSAHRGRGVGRALMRRLEEMARKQGHTALHVHAQVPVIPFYEALGYTAHGQPFLDARILHRAMFRAL